MGRPGAADTRAMLEEVFRQYAPDRVILVEEAAPGAGPPNAPKALSVLLCAHLLRTWRRDPLVLLGNRYDAFLATRIKENSIEPLG